MYKTVKPFTSITPEDFKKTQQIKLEQTVGTTNQPQVKKSYKRNIVKKADIENCLLDLDYRTAWNELYTEIADQFKHLNKLNTEDALIQKHKEMLILSEALNEIYINYHKKLSGDTSYEAKCKLAKIENQREVYSSIEKSEFARLQGYIDFYHNQNKKRKLDTTLETVENTNTGQNVELTPPLAPTLQLTPLAGTPIITQSNSFAQHKIISAQELIRNANNLTQMKLNRLYNAQTPPSQTPPQTPPLLFSYAPQNHTQAVNAEQTAVNILLSLNATRPGPF